LDQYSDFCSARLAASLFDIELLDYALAHVSDGFSLPSAFLSIFSDLAARNTNTILKVILVSYGPQIFRNSTNDECRTLVVPVGNSRSSARIRRGGDLAREKRFKSRQRSGIMSTMPGRSR